MTKYLVTGGAGFIGSHLVTALVKKGYEVRVLDNLSGGKEENFIEVQKQMEFIKGDIRNEKLVCQAMMDIDYVVHLAALVSVSDSVNRPEEYNDVNVNGTLNLLKAARNPKIKKFVLASSCAVYGNSEKKQRSESDSINPLSPYAATKLAAERHCQSACLKHGLETVILRYFNVYGPRQTSNSEYTSVIQKFINCAMKGENPPIYGDGEQSRDFTYIEDIVEASMSICNGNIGKGEVYNVAGGDSKTILNIVEELSYLLGKCIKPIFLPPRHGDIKHIYSDSRKIRNALKWETAVTFREGLQKTLSWQRQIMSLNNY